MLGMALSTIVDTVLSAHSYSELCVRAVCNVCACVHWRALCVCGCVCYVSCICIGVFFRACWVVRWCLLAYVACWCVLYVCLCVHVWGRVVCVCVCVSSVQVMVSCMHCCASV